MTYVRGWDRDGVHWDEVLDTSVEDGEDIDREYPMVSFGEDACAVYPMQTNQVDHMSLNRNDNIPYLMAPSLPIKTELMSVMRK